MGRNKYPDGEGKIPEKIQVRINESEQREFYEAWKELEPDLEWASFCRKMIKKGIERLQEDQRIIKEFREKKGVPPR
jgi:hypothetical protein